MAIAVTLDQRTSRRMPDRVSVMADRLNASLTGALMLPFVRTAGDEMQAIVGTGEGLASVARQCLEASDWWIGVGLGSIDQPVGPTARDSRGPAFWHAREAVERAQQHKGGSPGPVAVRGEPAALAEDLEAALSAMAFIVKRRTQRQQVACDLARQESGLQPVANTLGISSSAVSQLLRGAGLEEQSALERLVAHLAEDVL